MQNAILRHKASDGNYTDHELVNQVTTLGRSSSNDVVINDTSISRLHIRVENRNGQYFLVDNNSSNGTFLNRRKVSEAPLKDGDEIMAGRVHLFFSLTREADGADRTQAMSVVEENDPAAASTLNLNLKTTPEVGQTISEQAIPMSPAFHEPDETSMAPPPLPSPPPGPKGGTPLPVDDEPWNAPIPIPVPTASPSASVPPPQPVAPPVPTNNRPQPIVRLKAYLVDLAIILGMQVPFFLLGFVMSGFITTFLSLIASVAGLAYIIVAWHKYGKTYGKHLMKIRIIETGNATQTGLPPKTVALRLIGYIISAIPCGLGFLFIFFNEEGLGVQDKIAGTEVIEE